MDAAMQQSSVWTSSRFRDFVEKQGSNPNHAQVSHKTWEYRDLEGRSLVKDVPEQKAHAQSKDGLFRLDGLYISPLSHGNIPNVF
jgi:hypothetical protein